MTPKEKAKEMVSKNFDVLKNPLGYKSLKESGEKMFCAIEQIAKQSALIGVDSILYVLDTTECNTTLTGLMRKEFWQEVKKEIENL
jgi:hypothetical protein